MKLSLCLLLLLLMSSSSSSSSSSEVRSFLTETEWEICKGLMKWTQAKTCYAAPENVVEHSAANAMKKLSAEGIYTVFFKKEHWKKYVGRKEANEISLTAVVLKETSLERADYLRNAERIQSSYVWLIFDNSNGTLRQDLRKVEIPFDCTLLLIEKAADGGYAISEYYQIKKFAPGVLAKLAEWKDGRLVQSAKKWTDRKSDMQNQTFTTVKFSEDLYVTPKDKVNEEIWKDLSSILNFTIVEKVVKYSAEKGPVDLEAEEDEVLLDTQIYLGHPRNYTYLLGPTSETKLYMHVKASGEYCGFNRFVKPFSSGTWWCLGVWVFVCGLAVVLFDTVSGTFEASRRWQNESWLLFFMPLHSLCNQGGSEVGRDLASLLALFSVRISGSIIYYAYAATFLSYLLLFVPQLPFTDLKGLVEDGSYKVEGERNSDADTYFSISSDPMEKLVYRKYFSDVKSWSRFDKGVDRMCAGEKLVLLGYDDDIDKYMPCNVIKIKKPLKVFANGFKLRFRSPFRGILHVKLLKMRDAGILQRVNKRIISTAVSSDKFHRRPTYDINIEKVHSVFVVFGVGCSLSLCIFLLENAVSRLNTLSLAKENCCLCKKNNMFLVGLKRRPIVETIIFTAEKKYQKTNEVRKAYRYTPKYVATLFSSK